MKFIKRKIYWDDYVEQDVYLTVSYRKKSDAELPENYTIVTENLLVDTEGNIPSHLVIEFPESNTEYLIKYLVNGFEGLYSEAVKTPSDFTVLPIGEQEPILTDEVGFEIKFVDEVDIELNRSLFADTFMGLEKSLNNELSKNDSAQVYVEQEKLIMEFQGANTDTNKYLTGSSIATKKYCGFGKYVVKAKIPKVEGAMFSMWISNGLPEYEFINGSQAGFGYSPNYILANYPTGAINDDEFHNYEIRWSEDAIDFYLDGAVQATWAQNTPEQYGRFYIGTWFQNQETDFAFSKVQIERIIFEPYENGTNTFVAEINPFESFKEYAV